MKKLYAVLIIILFSALLTSCSAGPADGPSAEDLSATDAQPSPQEQKVLRIAAGRSFRQGRSTSTYLHFSTNVWESLVLFDDSMEPMMVLAESIIPSDDGLTWTINLREGISLHDGSVLNAKVAAFNLERLFRYNPVAQKFDPEFARTGEFGQITNISAISEYSLTVTHLIPVPDFPARLSMGNSAMFALSSFDEDRVIMHPYGSGPFIYSHYDERNHVLRLQRFERYRLGKPSVETVYFFSIPDASTRLAALQSDEIDVIADVGGVLPQQANEIISNPDLVLKQRQVSTVHYIALNSFEGSLFSDVRMRNAVSLSIDREMIVDVMLQGFGVPAISVITDLSAEWVVNANYRFDPDEAAALVHQAMGNQVPDAVILINSAWMGRWPYQDVALMFQAQLIQIGINALVEIVDNATWSERMRGGDYDIALHPATISAGEPIYFFVRVIESNGPDNISRGYGINNPDMDALIARAAGEIDVGLRREFIAELQYKVREADYIVPIWYDVTLYAMNARVLDFELDVLFRPDLFGVRVK